MSQSAAVMQSPSLKVNEAREAIASLVSELMEDMHRSPNPSDVETVPLESALNRILSSNLLSTIDVPVADNSAMDGFAFRGKEMERGAKAIALQVVASAFAGKPYLGSVKDGECVQIMTGALMPADCDTVIPLELVSITNTQNIQTIEFQQGIVKTGENRRLRGEDLKRGTPAILAGRLLRPSDLGMAASLGIGTLTVRRKLKVAILSSGNELRTVGEILDVGSIYDSNRFSLIGLLNRLNLEIIDCGIVRDDPVALKEAFCQAAQQADVLISSGGVSVGEADYTKQIMQELGDVGFWKIAMRPGRPMAFGTLKPLPGKIPSRKTLFFGLPGNPVAVMVTFYQFVRAALLQLNGATQTEVPIVQALSTAAIRKKPGRTEFQRAILGRNENGQATVSITGSQGAGILRSVSEANCFVVLAHEQGNIAAGDWVDVVLFDGLL